MHANMPGQAQDTFNHALEAQQDVVRYTTWCDMKTVCVSEWEQ